jgi:hypothetical protein
MTQNKNSCQVFGNTKYSPLQKKFRTAPSSGEAKLILFFGSKGILQHWLPQNQTVNGVYCAYTLKTHSRNAIKKYRLELLMKQWFLLYDIGGTPVEHPL